jgi:hypothetical protein
LMNKKSVLLLNQAREKADELSRHPVLSQHWEHLSLILKGSTSRGNADRYSDIDLVFYASEEDRQSIVSAYHAQGLADRTDGIFMFFPNGHYHIESFEALEAYFTRQDFVHCWEVEHAVALSDPTNRFGQIVQAGQQRLFERPLDIVKRAYLDLQLDLDWMRMPITRGDAIATFLHAAKLVQGLCRIAYLMDGRSYPPDKWVARYLSSTRWGRAHGKALRSYLVICNQVNSLVVHDPYKQHALYRQAAALIGAVGRSIRKSYGDQPWLDAWYNYV